MTEFGRSLSTRLSRYSIRRVVGILVGAVGVTTGIITLIWMLIFTARSEDKAWRGYQEGASFSATAAVFGVLEHIREQISVLGVVSDKTIGSPVVRNPMHLVAMNRPSLDKFGPVVKPEGIILINSSLIKIRSGRDDVDEFCVPVNKIARDLGSEKAANIVALSAFVYRSKIVGFRTLCKSIRHNFSKKKELIPLYMEAARKGKKAARKDEENTKNEALA